MNSLASTPLRLPCCFRYRCSSHCCLLLSLPTPTPSHWAIGSRRHSRPPLAQQVLLYRSFHLHSCKRGSYPPFHFSHCTTSRPDTNSHSPQENCLRFLPAPSPPLPPGHTLYYSRPNPSQISTRPTSLHISRFESSLRFGCPTQMCSADSRVAR